MNRRFLLSFLFGFGLVRLIFIFIYGFNPLRELFAWDVGIAFDIILYLIFRGVYDVTRR